ncbi:MAG: 3-keto-disaccharide hydrolase [Limisphaerales bacterium]
MKTQLTLVSLCFALTALAGEPEWTPLFDGQTTKGWTPRGEVVRFEAKNGVLELETQKNVWVVSDLKMDNFIIEMEVKVPQRANFNSGLAFRCIGDKGKPKGYQAEVDSRNPSQTGGVYGIGLGGWLYPKAAQKKEFAEKTKGAYRPKEWNKIRVRAAGHRIQTWVNDRPVADFRDSQSLEGYFGIQHHGGGDVVRFRNIRAKKALVIK